MNLYHNLLKHSLNQILCHSKINSIHVEKEQKWKQENYMDTKITNVAMGHGFLSVAKMYNTKVYHDSSHSLHTII